MPAPTATPGAVRRSVARRPNRQQRMRAEYADAQTAAERCAAGYRFFTSAMAALYRVDRRAADAMRQELGRALMQAADAALVQAAKAAKGGAR